MSYEDTMVERRIALAESRANALERERDAALAELAKVKADVKWCMEKGIIRDVFGSAAATREDCGGPFADDGQDGARLEYLNGHARVWLGDGVFCLAIPHPGAVGDVTVPVPYNIRHILDICRGTWIQRAEDPTP